jgi:hypothetical protein
MEVSPVCLTINVVVENQELKFFPIFNKSYASKQTKRPNYELVLGDSPITTEDLRSSLQKKNKYAPVEVSPRRVAAPVYTPKVALTIAQRDPNVSTQVLLPAEKIIRTQISGLTEEMIDRSANDTWWIEISGSVLGIIQKPSSKEPRWKFLLVTLGFFWNEL